MKKYDCLMVISVSAILFAAVAAWVFSGGSADFDQWAYQSLIHNQTPALDAFVAWFTRLCDPLPVVTVCLALLLIPPTRRTVAVPVTGCAAFASVVGVCLKHVFRRARPSVPRLVMESGFSFPSNHSAVSAAVGVALILLLVRSSMPPKRKAPLFLLCGLFPILIGLSRIYVGVHYASDVLAGWLYGIAVGWLTDALWKRFRVQDCGKRTR